MERESSVECSLFFCRLRKAVGYEIVLREIQRCFLHGAAQNVLFWNSTKAAKVFSLYGQENYVLRIVYVGIHVSTGTAKFSHITAVLRSLHWLPIKQRVQFKMLILIFKAINGLAPNYISNLVNILCPSKYLLRRNNEILLEPYNGKTKKTLGDRAFAVAAPRLFNSLPREIRHETCFNTFKTKVKTFLFRMAFC